MEITQKEGEVVPVTSDRMFKAILMDSKEYLADILSNILDIDKNYILDNLVFKNTEQGILGVSEKRKVTDLIVDINKLTINLEMNASYSKASVRKNNAYISRIMIGAIESGEDYAKLDIVVVQINFDKVWKFEEEINQTKIETVKKMKEENIPLDTIIKITDLTKEKIEKL